MTKPLSHPVALTIAGSDSGGGAGIQADLKTFAALGVHGTSAITSLTAQNPKEILGIHPCPAEMVQRQMAAVFRELSPRSVKTGMLFNAEIIAEVARFFRRGKKLPLIVDPVMVATSGAPLLEAAGVACLKEELLPLATLITPNLDEVKVLCGFAVQDPEDLRTVARLLHKNYRCAVLIKGGHLADTKSAVDIFYDGRTELLLSAPFIKGISTHGTGCTYSAAIAAYCALGHALPQAVSRSKEYITQAIAKSHRVAGHSILNCARQS